MMALIAKYEGIMRQFPRRDQCSSMQSIRNFSYVYINSMTCFWSVRGFSCLNSTIVYIKLSQKFSRLVNKWCGHPLQ